MPGPSQQFRQQLLGNPSAELRPDLQYTRDIGEVLLSLALRAETASLRRWANPMSFSTRHA